MKLKNFELIFQLYKKLDGQGKEELIKKILQFFSGPKTRTGQCGTGFIIDAQTRKSFISFKPVNDRICKIRLKHHFRNISLISIQAPTEDSKKDGKIAFYDKLYKECEKVPKYDMLIILGNFNAKIGTEDFLKDIAGKFTLHLETNENGKLLSQLAASYNLIIKSTCFNHKKYIKVHGKSQAVIMLIKQIIFQYPKDIVHLYQILKQQEDQIVILITIW